MIGDGIHAALLDNAITDAPVRPDALKTHHAAGGPHLVGLIAMRDHQVDVIRYLRITEQRENRAIARLFLISIETLTA